RVFEHPYYVQLARLARPRILRLYVEVLGERLVFAVETGELQFGLPSTDVEVGPAGRKVGRDDRGILLGAQRGPYTVRRIVFGNGGLEPVADVLGVGTIHALQEEGL